MAFDLLDRPEIGMVLFHPRPEYAHLPESPEAYSVRFTMADRTVIGGRLHPAGGTAPAVLFFHGNGEIASDYDDLAPLYHRLGLTLLVADYRGYGISGGHPTATALAGDALEVFDQTPAVLAAAGLKPAKLLVMGRSMGSAAALVVAEARGAALASLIIESGFADTLPLVERLGHLTVIELDRDLARQLRGHGQLTVIESDVLKVAFDAIAATSPAGKLRVTGNLPYNISTPILFHLLQFVDSIEDQHFMLQKEVVDRMVARPGTAAYGRLSVMLQWRYAMENVLLVGPGSFDPPPRVDSAIVRMLPHAQPAALNVLLLSELVQVAFSQRRKLLRHTLGKWLDGKKFSGNFDVQRRAEEVPVHEYLALAAALAAVAA